MPPVSYLQLHLAALFLILIGIPQSFSTDLYTSCSNLFSCGTIKDVGFPFWGGSRPSNCGYPQLELSCEENSTFIVIENVKYIVWDVLPQTQVLRIARQDFLLGICSTKFLNTTLDDQVFDWVSGYTNITFVYGCSTVFPYLITFKCSGNGLEPGGYFQPGASGTPQGCSASVVVPVSASFLTSFDLWFGNLSIMETAVRDGFEVALKVDNQVCNECVQSKGICGYNFTANQPTCYCFNDRYSASSSTCTSSTTPSSGISSPPDTVAVKKNDVSLGVGIAIGGAAVLGILLLCWLFFLLQRKNPKVKINNLHVIPSSKSLLGYASSFSQTTASDPSPKSDIENGSTYLGVPVFSYDELAEATFNFEPSREIGDGGFGVVYYGELRDGRVAAIKRLYASNMKKVEQFMNEIEILTRLQHQNLVKLYGCTSSRSRDLILVYEYIPNGTVADHLFGKRASSVLPWQLRLNIAIDTADALGYLHRSDVVHRDVKTNNILLDNNFHVKVADFGLSRLFPTDVTHVSTAPQGSPGYVDPDYYKTYRLTDKSDVYSFGVVLCELISSKPAVDTNRHRHDINLASMAVRKIQNRALHEFVDPRLGFETDYGVRRMVTSVAELTFRCLQEERDMRPTMEEVLETLKRIEISKEHIEALRGFGRVKEQTENKTAAADVISIRSHNVEVLKNVPPFLSLDLAESLK